MIELLCAKCGERLVAERNDKAAPDLIEVLVFPCKTCSAEADSLRKALGIVMRAAR